MYSCFNIAVSNFLKGTISNLVIALNNSLCLVNKALKALIKGGSNIYLFLALGYTYIPTNKVYWKTHIPRKSPGTLIVYKALVSVCPLLGSLLFKHSSIAYSIYTLRIGVWLCLGQRDYLLRCTMANLSGPSTLTIVSLLLTSDAAIAFKAAGWLSGCFDISHHRIIRLA